MDLMRWLHASPSLKPLYYVVGEEAFLIKEIKKKLIKSLFNSDKPSDFNYDDREASQGVIGLISAIETLPVLNERRLVFCSSAQNFSTKDWEDLEIFLEKPVSSSVLVLFFDKIDGRKKFFKKLKENGEKLVAEPLREWQVDPWIDFLAKSLGLKLTSSARLWICQWVGTNLMEISNEMKKLKSYVGERTEVQEQDVLSVFSRARMDNVFNFTNAIGKKDIVYSLDCLARLLENQQSSIGILALLARHIRILQRIHEGQKKGMRKGELQVLAGVPPYFLQNYISQASLWTEKQIQQAMEVIYETEKALKSSPLSSSIWLENFVLKLCHS